MSLKYIKHSLATKLRAGRSGVRIPVGARDFTLLQNDETGSAS